MLFYCFFVCRFSLRLFRRCHKLNFAPLKLLQSLSPSQAPHKLLFNDLPPSDSVERSWTSWLLKFLTQNSLNSSSADEEPNAFWAKDLCSQDLFLEGTFGPEVTSASTRRGLITVLDQAEDLAENIPIPFKMFKIFQLNRRAASRWNATCEELEMVPGFVKVSSHFCDWSQFQLSVDVNNRVRGNVSGWKANSSPGRFSLGTRLGGKLTCTLTCVALFEAAGVCDRPKSLSTPIKGETVVGKTFLRNLRFLEELFGGRSWSVALVWRGRWRQISRLRIFVKPSTSFVQDFAHLWLLVEARLTRPWNNYKAP